MKYRFKDLANATLYFPEQNVIIINDSICKVQIAKANGDIISLEPIRFVALDEDNDYVEACRGILGYTPGFGDTDEGAGIFGDLEYVLVHDIYKCPGTFPTVIGISIDDEHRRFPRLAFRSGCFHGVDEDPCSRFDFGIRGIRTVYPY